MRLSLVKIFIFIILISLIAVFCTKDLNNLKVIFLDVGQGDATLIKTPQNINILIDGGPDNKLLRQIDSYLKFYERRIDVVVISHSHDDHISGLIEVIRRYKVRKIFFSSDIKRTVLLNSLLIEAENRNIKTIPINNFRVYKIDNYCNLEIMSPSMFVITDNDNNSLVSKLICSDIKILFTGDNENLVEKYILSTDYDLKSEIFKAAHHGSRTSNTDGFLEKVNAKYFIISVGENNMFNHPSAEVLESVSRRGMKILRTDILGNIAFSFKIVPH